MRLRRHRWVDNRQLRAQRVLRVILHKGDTDTLLDDDFPDRNRVRHCVDDAALSHAGMAPVSSNDVRRHGVIGGFPGDPRVAGLRVEPDAAPDWTIVGRASGSAVHFGGRYIRDACPGAPVAGQVRHPGPLAPDLSRPGRVGGGCSFDGTASRF